MISRCEKKRDHEFVNSRFSSINLQSHVILVAITLNLALYECLVAVREATVKEIMVLVLKKMT